jgi:hypothetical protein
MQQEDRKVGRFEDGTDRILVELKTVERLLPIHEAQVVTYLRLAHLFQPNRRSTDLPGSLTERIPQATWNPPLGPCTKSYLAYWAATTFA